MNAIALHEDCVVCLASAEGRSSEDGTKIVLMMLCRGVEPEQIHRDLCFKHRREVEDAVRRWEEADPA